MWGDKNKGMVGREPERMGEKLCAWVIAMQWWMEKAKGAEDGWDRNEGLRLMCSVYRSV
jgi:hypothetical protein